MARNSRPLVGVELPFLCRLVAKCFTSVLCTLGGSTLGLFLSPTNEPLGRGWESECPVNWRIMRKAIEHHNGKLHVPFWLAYALWFRFLAWREHGQEVACQSGLCMATVSHSNVELHLFFAPSWVNAIINCGGPIGNESPRSTCQKWKALP